jgi:hypothetical protein
MLERAGLDSAMLDEPVDFVFFEPDHTPESVGGNVTLINDGVATAAVLRPASGAVYVFDSWATDGRDVSVAPTRTVVGATDVHARDSGDGCSTLVVTRPDGTEEEIGS